MNTRRQTVWQSLLDAGLVTGPIPESRALASPWYVRLMLGIAGWIAALFLLGFIEDMMDMVWNDVASLVTGVVMMCAAWLMLRKLSGNDFAAQFALALSFAGQALYAWGLFGWIGTEPEGANTEYWLVMTLTQAVLAAVMLSSIHRVWSAFAAAIAWSMALHSLGLYFVPSATMMALAAWIWLNEFTWPQSGSTIRPLAYGLTLALLTIEMATGLFPFLAGTSTAFAKENLLEPWTGELLLGAVLLWVVWSLLRRSGAAMPGRFATTVLTGTAVLALVSLKAPGISVGVGIILLGYAHGNRVLTGLGMTALLLYVSTYYYSLDVTLLVKSQVLALTGATLLVLRWILARWLPGQTETDND